MTVKEIVREWLGDHGYIGLTDYNGCFCDFNNGDLLRCIGDCDMSECAPWGGA
jgi:hypothetical protein